MRFQTMRKRFVRRKTKVRRKHKYRFFVSYVTEDKRSIVKPVTDQLDKLEISYFLDSKHIIWGNGLNRSLSDGLNKSEYFVPFISLTYTKKRWSMVELQAALHKQIAEDKSYILPILIGTKAQRERILKEIPLLANMLHLVWDGNAAKTAISLAARLNQNDRI